MASIGRFGPQARIALPLLQAAAKDPKNQQSPATMQNIDRLVSFLEQQVPEAGKDRAGDIPPPSK